MRSCEYLKVPTSTQEDRKMKLLKMKNICFFKKGKELPHSHPSLESAEIVAITFEDQKNREKFETIHLSKLDDSLLCPVKSWASTIRHIHKYPGSTRNTPVDMFLIGKKFYQFSSKDATDALRKEAGKIGEKF